jgi:hypothetical protein
MGINVGALTGFFQRGAKSVLRMRERTIFAASLHTTLPDANEAPYGIAADVTNGVQVSQPDGMGGFDWVVPTDVGHAHDSTYVNVTGDTMTGDLLVPDEAYGVGWNASLEVPTKNAIYDKIEAFAAGAYTDEQTRDAMAAALVAGNNIDITVNDAGDTITIDVETLTAADITDFATAVDERARDALGTALTAGTGITVTPNDGADTITVATTITQYTDEMAQDAVGVMLVDSSEIDFTYTDATPALTAVLKAGSIDEAKLDASVNASLDLADSAVQDLGDLGITATASELNTLDGITSSTAELNILDGVTATAAELNALDGITATVTELNYTDGVTSAIQTQLNAKQTLDDELTAIAGLTSAADRLPYFTGSGAAALATFPASGRALVNLPVAAADKLAYFTGATTATLTDLSSTSRTMLAHTNTTQWRTSLSVLGISGGTFTGDVSVPDEAYGVGWDGSVEVPTKNAVYDKIETIVAGAIADHTHTGAGSGGVLGPAALGIIGIYQDADYTASNSSSAQKVFNESANGAANVAADTTYEIEGAYHIHTTGTTSHTFAIQFGGTATLTSIGYLTQYTIPATEVGGAVLSFWQSAAAGIPLNGAMASASHHDVYIRGLVRINAAGTFIPQFKWSSAPGGTTTVLANSFFKLTPVGSGSVTTVGSWS